MPDLDEIGGWITGQLPALTARSKVPGAVIGAYRSAGVLGFAVGLLSQATGVEAAGSVFQIGSITKTWSAALVMQLLDIDRPLVAYLPGFGLADSAAGREMTARQLLSRAAGFEGDIFTDTNEDAVENRRRPGARADLVARHVSPRERRGDARQGS